MFVNIYQHLLLSKDIALKQSKVKIENIKDVTVFQFVKNSIMGGLSDSIKSNVQLDNNKQTITYLDISSVNIHSK